MKHCEYVKISVTSSNNCESCTFMFLMQIILISLRIYSSLLLLFISYENLRHEIYVVADLKVYEIFPISISELWWWAVKKLIYLVVPKLSKPVLTSDLTPESLTERINLYESVPPSMTINFRSLILSSSHTSFQFSASGHFFTFISHIFVNIF